MLIASWFEEWKILIYLNKNNGKKIKTKKIKKLKGYAVIEG